ncbi:MAG: helix-turn-helix transcriptional regulator [Clostridia bacterium]|nr:helix-turn-helix transcriptional regulator [Clostridia bacterium]
MISYAPFWNTLKEKNMTTYTLINKYHISSATIDRIKKGKGITTMKLDDFCRILQCRIEDLVEYLPDAEPPFSL